DLPAGLEAFDLDADFGGRFPGAESDHRALRAIARIDRDDVAADEPAARRQRDARRDSLGGNAEIRVVQALRDRGGELIDDARRIGRVRAADSAAEKTAVAAARALEDVRPVVEDLGDEALRLL